MSKRKHAPYQIGDLVINSGNLLGMGYIWRVTEVWPQNPHDETDHRQWISLLAIDVLHRPLSGKQDPRVGVGTMLIPSDYRNKMKWDGKIKPPQQGQLF